MKNSALLAIVLTTAAAGQSGLFSRRDYFVPANTLSGIGVGRADVSEAVLARRTELMIESQTFSILRDPQALAGAKRITSPKLQALFADASRRSGVPASFLAAIAYLESWGISNAQSPAGPKGIMQIAAATGRSMGLRQIYATRYRNVVERRQIRTKRGKITYQTRRSRVPYQVLVRDERLVPERAVPAAAQYLARLESKFGGRDWAVWAYHCGEGCTAEVRSIASRSNGINEPFTVADVFFGAHPARNRDLWNALETHMDRDFSPTYWFRIMRAEQLIRLYQRDPDAYERLWEEYRYRINPAQRAPHRLSVWLKPADFAYRNCEDLRREEGRSLVRVLDHPRYFGFALASGIGVHDPANRQYYLQASPAAVGALAYITYETRRLHEAMKTRESWAPLEVSSLVMPMDEEQKHGADGVSHCSGQVFDLSARNLPPGQREALEFVLKDMGWDGYLGFVRENASGDAWHVGTAPTAREFFTRVYNEAVEKIGSSD